MQDNLKEFIRQMREKDSVSWNIYADYLEFIYMKGGENNGI